MASYSETGGYCRHCDRRVVVKREATNHILHLLMCLLTGGFWLIVMLFTVVKFGGWHCSQCGSRAQTSIPLRVRWRSA